MTDAPGDGPREVLLDVAAIQAEVTRLAAAISADYADRRLHLVGVLKSAAVFVADLMRALAVPATVDFIATGPYNPASASGVVRLRKDLDDPLEGLDVLLVEGVCGSGRTLAYLLRNFATRNPASLATCVLLAKRRERLADVRLDYVGREIDDVLVVGYGLGLEERHRQLPHVARVS